MNKSGYLSLQLVSVSSLFPTPPPPPLFCDFKYCAYTLGNPASPFLRWCSPSVSLTNAHWAVPGSATRLEGEQWMSQPLTAWLLVFASEEATCRPHNLLSFLLYNNVLEAFTKADKKSDHFLRRNLGLAEKWPSAQDYLHNVSGQGKIKNALIQKAGVSVIKDSKLQSFFL